MQRIALGFTDTQIVEGDILAVVLDNLLHDPRAVVNCDRDAVFFRKLVFDAGAVFGPRKSTGHANDPVVGPTSVHNPLNVAADLLGPLLLGAEGERPSLAVAVRLADIDARDFIGDRISLRVSLAVTASFRPRLRPQIR